MLNWRRQKRKWRRYEKGIKNNDKSTDMILKINIKYIIAVLMLILLTTMTIATIYHTAANRIISATTTMQWQIDTCWGGWMETTHKY